MRTGAAEAVTDRSLFAGAREAKTRVAFVVNGGPASPMGERARAFAERLSGEHQIAIVYREANKIRAIGKIFTFLKAARPQVVYVFDIGYSGVLAALFYRIVSRCRVVVETGDAITELARSSGMRSPFGLALTYLLETVALRASSQVVVRGSFHQELLRRQGIASEVIPDGVDTQVFRPLTVNGLRKQHGLEDVVTVGFVGSCIWSERLQMCYGWELIELLRLLPDQRVKGVIIGDGSGLPRLRNLCQSYGIEDRVVFLGRVAFEKLPEYLNLIDICLSTQTNDIAGQVRTTGKLPLYLGCGRFVLATNVGEAAVVLDPLMLVPYSGSKDSEYPKKLADRVRKIMEQPEVVRNLEGRVKLAIERFEYTVLARKVGAVIRDVTAAG